LFFAVGVPVAAQDTKAPQLVGFRGWSAAGLRFGRGAHGAKSPHLRNSPRWQV